MVKFLQERRKKLFELLQEQEMAVIFAAEQNDSPIPFLQNNNFLYFTGLNTPGAILLFYRAKQQLITFLFIERGIPEREVWDGKKMTIEEAAKLSGIEKVLYLDEFQRTLEFYLHITQKFYLNLDSHSLSDSIDRKHQLVERIRLYYPEIVFSDVVALMRPLRSVKDEWEIEQLRKAIDVTGTGIKQIMSKALPGMMEYELEAILNYEALRKNLRHMGFKSIIAAGINAATLHYISNDSRVEENDLVLLDVGAACNNYCADITRTFPISGKFTKRQREVYSEVLAIQKEIINMIKPGISLPELNDRTITLIKEALIRLGLIKADGDYRKYYMHSVSHHLGMDAHDLGLRDSVLSSGNVITVEPGIYIPEENIGVRIEDDILVTVQGFENLSVNIPKEIDQLEEICRK
ncbi:MAG: aminopeptidase P family protein [Candidatus Cloacimonetes bacterium]|nr:aminopeptidase P family protein [Candidatus Cloacimonadota bacterium]